MSLKELIRPYYLRWVYFKLSPGSRPAYFEDCWQHPFQRLGDPGVAGLIPPRGSGPDILWYPMTDWHTRMQRTQHLARCMAQLGCRGVYLNPHMGREFETSPAADRKHRLALLEPNLVELHVRLPREPVFHHRLLAPGETRVVVEAMEEVLGAAKTVDAVQIVSLPTWWDAAVEIRRRHGYRILYDCHDLLSGFSNMAPEIVAAEEHAFAEADGVVFSSKTLLELHPEVQGKAMLLRNGADVSRFSPAAGKSGTKPIVGYVGAIEAWFEIAMVREAAMANPDCRFVIAGRIENAAAGRLAGLPNVEMIGEVAYDQVPGLVRQFDVGLIPFVVNELTRAADPIKLYEYFACGIPVVSSQLPEVEVHGNLVYPAADAAGFARAVQAALLEDDSIRRARRIEVSQHSSWMERARQLYQEMVAPRNSRPRA